MDDGAGGCIGDVERVEDDVASLAVGVEVLWALREGARNNNLVASVREGEVIMTRTV